MSEGERTTDRALLAAGAAVFAVALAAWTLLALAGRVEPAALAGQVVAHAALGKETGIPAGLALGSPVPVAIGVSVAQDLVVMLVGLSLVGAARRRALEFPTVARLAAALAARPPPSRRSRGLGVGLVALSVWVPFLPAGALAAAVAARAVGYETRLFAPALAFSVVASGIVYGAASAALLDLAGDGRAGWVLAVAAGATSLAVGWTVARRTPEEGPS